MTCCDLTENFELFETLDTLDILSDILSNLSSFRDILQTLHLLMFLRRQMTTDDDPLLYFLINKKLFCLFQVFKMFKVDKTRTLSYWVECQLSCSEKKLGYQGDPHELRVTKSCSTLRLVHRDPHRGPLKSTQNLQNFEFVYFSSVLLPPISTIYF